MKQLVLNVWLSILLVSMPFVGQLGCQAPTAQKISYGTLSTIATSVDSAMQSYGAAVKAGLVDEATQAKVRNLFNRYQPVMQRAVLAAKFDFSTQPPAELAAIAADLTTAIIIATKK